MWKRVLAILFAITLIAAACGSDDAADTATADADDSSAATTEPATDDEATEEEMTEEEMDEEEMAEEEMAEPVTGPASIAAEDQTGTGDTVTIASVTLPTAGFVAIHSDADGGPGPVIGNSDLLPAGESIDVVVTFNAMIDANTTLFPMLHVDANENGAYDFAPPDVVDDVPATTADGDVAVLPINYTIG